MKKQLLSIVVAASLSAMVGASHHNGEAHSGHGHGHDEMNQSDHHGKHGDGHHKGHDKHHGEGHGKGHGKGHANGHHGHAGHGHGESLAGRPGKESEVDRTITVEANDAMRFVHEPIKVKTGETIKFVITNIGAMPHEFSIGTKDEHMEHGKMMMANPDMHHGPGGSSITIAPGETETLIWYFEEAFEVQAACNIPGHYQAGMHSNVVFEN